MIAINMSDVLKVLDNCIPYLVGFLVLAAIVVAVIIAVRKLQVPVRKLVRAQCLVAIGLVLAVTINLICFGPMSTMLSLSTASEKHELSEESTAHALELCTKIAEEGYVLLKNEDNVLPLRSTNKLNVFGWASANPVYAGSGSGSLSDVYPTVSLLDGLSNAGFELNTELSDFYAAFREGRPDTTETFPDWTLPEPSVESYGQEMLDSAAAFSDTALIVLSRVSGEGVDLPNDMTSYFDGTRNTAEDAYLDNTMYPKGYYVNNDPTYSTPDFQAGDHYMRLSQREKDLVEMVCGRFSNVVVVYNGANVFELGWVDQHPEIKGVLWCAGAGQSGFNALGEILNGTVNPSGKTADMFVYDLTKTPTYRNFGNFLYDNMSEFDSAYYYYTYLVRNTQPSFVNYVEGIYVGYRFYETAAEEGFLNYDETVQYPFGYGLSYTSFSQEMGPMTVKDGAVSFEVTVTNTGSVAGKDVVEVFYHPPYTNGGIEKSAANLVAFDKTELLQPGASQAVEISFALEDMASFDEYGHGCYVLEEGDYTISINSDSHTVIDAQTYTQTDAVVYGQGAPRSTDRTAATSRFQYANGGVTYLSRADGFANYAAATAAPASLTMPADYKAQFISNSNYDPTAEDDPNAVMPVTGAKNGVVLADLRGKDYDDPLWEQLLDQLTVSEMDALISLTGYQTQAIPSVGKIATVECDGPVAVNNSFTGEATLGFTPAVVIANSWNEDLAYEYGLSMGAMAKEMGVHGWYAPAMNTHRSAFAGRNFEYYSEDGLLGGKLAAQAVAGAADQGVYAFIKHFALNEQETNRYYQLCTWSNEQAIREIYLKPFELAVKEGGATAVMTSLNHIGPVAAGSTGALLQDVLRDEWGFQGMVITDYFGVYGFQNADQQIRSGNDGCLIAYDVPEAHVRETSASGVQAMRTSCHNIMYTVANSWAYEDGGLSSIPAWTVILIVADILAAVVLLFIEFHLIRKYRRRRAS